MNHNKNGNSQHAKLMLNGNNEQVERVTRSFLRGVNSVCSKNLKYVSEMFLIVIKNDNLYDKNVQLC